MFIRHWGIVFETTAAKASMRAEADVSPNLPCYSLRQQVPATPMQRRTHSAAALRFSSQPRRQLDHREQGSSNDLKDANEQ